MFKGMFPPEIQVIFDARTALSAAQQKDPRFVTLVDKLIERTGLNKEQVITNIGELARGNVSI